MLWVPRLTEPVPQKDDSAVSSRVWEALGCGRDVEGLKLEALSTAAESSPWKAITRRRTSRRTVNRQPGPRS